MTSNDLARRFRWSTRDGGAFGPTFVSVRQATAWLRQQPAAAGGRTATLRVVRAEQRAPDLEFDLVPRADVLITNGAGAPLNYLSVGTVPASVERAGSHRCATPEDDNSESAPRSSSSCRDGALGRDFGGCPAQPAVTPWSIPASAATLAARPSPRVERTKVTEEGFYFHGGSAYKVVKSRYGERPGSLYAKRLDVETGTWKFAPRAIWMLAAEDKMTLDGAKRTAHKYGALTGRCFVCGRVLTDEESIEWNMGPICRGKFA